jgi:CubicO group peptidase (beta-lactamase class C family)
MALLFDPLGMDSIQLSADAGGNYIMSGWSVATALDWARFGQLYLDDGVWDGVRLLPPGWLDYALSPAPADDERVYGGAMLWRAERFYALGGSPAPLPERTALAAGHRGQRVFVIPDHDLVIVRMGHGDNEPLLAQTVARIVTAVSK